MKRKRAGAIIIRDEKILLIYRNKNGKEYYIIPGGGVESGETFEQAAVREAKEEVCLDVKVDRLFYTYSDELSEQYYFLCTSSGEPIIGDLDEFDTEEDIHRLEWVPAKDLVNHVLYPPEVQKTLIANLG